MAEDDQPSDIERPRHFATRDLDRGERGEMNRLFDKLDAAARQELLRYGQALLQQAKPP